MVRVGVRSMTAFDKAWGIAKAADWDTSFNFKEDREKAKWSQEDIDRLNADNDKVREELKENPLNKFPSQYKSGRMRGSNSWRATRPKRDALADALSRARRENAKPKPKMRITRPDDWE